MTRYADRIMGGDQNIWQYTDCKYKGTIIVDGVDSLEEAQEYIESCNPVDDVSWSDFLETMDGGIELKKISIPDSMAIREFADKIGVRQAEIIKWLFLRGENCKL